ncbi:FKBP-type peptidyl-prolyl cis-trans isomerase [Nonomuraea sp. MCN248]|uniref:peptidylprolyl isomerase n=1 Tax=Nonomuraea corallina TaxID=2989783 RepID=A0ABT4SAV4_9ACTN|nr:FKBP-type peptidyl-prolyl cis-trans isomerase [Nonomuraea corallina]MDA0634333.1 FKBP-type peptidyl-prolyl cis-trans isomerase [Nonomuraea corallina]
MPTPLLRPAPRRSLAVLASMALALVTACTGAEPGETEPRVTGPFGARPSITFPAGAPPAEPRVAERTAGHGAPLEQGGVAVVQYTAHLWDGRENRLVASTFNRGTPEALPLGALHPGLDAALRGRRAGSRVTAAIPLGTSGTPAGERPPGPQAGPAAPGVRADAVDHVPRAHGRVDLFYVVDVLGAHPGRDAVEAGAGVIAGVRVGGGAAPALAIPDGEPPGGLTARMLARGSGRAAEAGRLLVVQYAGATWSERRVFTSTWQRGRPEAVTLGDGSLVSGWNRALAGVPAGSRVAMVVPPGDAHGDAGTGGSARIAPGETLVYVVDVLAVY